MQWLWKGGSRHTSFPPAEAECIESHTGISSGQADELRSAAAAAIECGGDTVKFANGCEPALGRMRRAVAHLRQKNFSDEREILDSVGSKHELVHFFLDCVRHSFILRHIVRELRDNLVANSPAWQKAFRDHIACCETCKTVDLSHPAKPKPQPTLQSKLPIPFCIELLALFGTALPFVALSQGCDCQLRPWLVLLGAVLCLPLFCFEALWRLGQRQRLLWYFAAGEYAVDVQLRPLSRLWSPSRVDVQEGQGKLADTASQQRQCLSYGQWFRRTLPLSGASIERQVGMPDAGKPGSKDVGPNTRGICVTCKSLGWTSASAVMETGGAIQGLSSKGVFDGNSITWTASRGGEAKLWLKMGWWRLDWLYKTLMVLAVLGVTVAGSAAAFHPGLTSECGPKTSIKTRSVRTPIRAVFLIDASSSIGGSDFLSEKRATAAIIGAFEQAYQSDVKRLHVGIMQFATNHQLVQPITNDLAVVKGSLNGMTQLGGGTSFAGPLGECQKMLNQYAAAGSQTFDLCILITDGMSDESNSELKNVLASTVHLMGIYVGSNDQHSAKLHGLSSCSTPFAVQCPFFESATDFALLQSRATDLASQVTTGLTEEVTERVITYECDTPFWTLSTLALWLPLISWWCYLHCPRWERTAPAAPKHVVKDPKRLATAGRNEERTML